jgi:hypothetical protein
MTWAALEEEQGDPVRAEEIRNLYFQQVSKLVIDAYGATPLPVHVLHYI